MAEFDARTTRLAVLLGVLVIVIVLAAAIPHQANRIVGVAIGMSLLVICWLKGKRGFASLGDRVRLATRFTALAAAVALNHRLGRPPRSLAVYTA